MYIYCIDRYLNILYTHIYIDLATEARSDYSPLVQTIQDLAWNSEFLPSRQLKVSVELRNSVVNSHKQLCLGALWKSGVDGSQMAG